ncbi:MAG: DUF4397 domain-containing protein [Pseudomonadota bacterium]
MSIFCTTFTKGQPAFSRLCAAILAATLGLLGACTDVQDAPEGRGNIRAVHALSALGEVGFLIEERVLANASYQTVTPFSTYDSLQYDFNFDFNSGLTGERARLATTSVTVAPDTNYTLILTGTPTAPEILTVAQPIASFDAAATNLSLWFSNLSSANSVDIYVGTTGFDPAAVAPLATGLAPGAVTDVTSVEAGEVEFIATVAGDPTQVLIRSETRTLIAQDVALVGLLDAARVVNGDYVFILGGELNSGRLADDAAPTTLRVIHGIRGADAVDLYINDETVTPVVSALGFPMASTRFEIPEADDAATVTLNVTAAGNVGAPIVTVDSVFADASSSLAVVANAPSGDGFGLLSISESRRPLFDAGLVGVVNASGNIDLIDIYFVASDDTFEDTAARARNAGPSQNIGQFTLEADTYEFYVTDGSNETIVAGPIPVTVEAGDVLQLMIIDVDDPTALGVVEFDRLAP